MPFCFPKCMTCVWSLFGTDAPQKKRKWQKKVKDLMQVDAFEKDVISYVKPNHGTTTLAFVFQHGVIVAVDSRASQGSYICECLDSEKRFEPH